MIGGDTVNARLILDMKPLQFALVRLYFSTGKTAWAGVTDMDGSFRITRLPSGTYGLEVRGWGSTTIRLDPKLNNFGTQVPDWDLELMEDECVGAGFSLD